MFKLRCRRVARILPTGGGASAVLTKLSSYLYPSPFPPKFFLSCCTQCYIVVNFLGIKIKHDSLQFIAYREIFVRSDRGGYSPLFLPPGYATASALY